MDTSVPSAGLHAQHHAVATHAQARAASERLVRGLAWFSIALGAAELLAPRRIGKAAGMRGRDPLLRLHGLRELGAGIALLSAEEKAPWLMGRIAGDALDLATLASGLGRRGARGRTVAAIAAVGAVTWLDLKAARRCEQQRTQARNEPFDYSDRSGFARSPDEMRGAA